MLLDFNHLDESEDVDVKFKIRLSEKFKTSLVLHR
jgi:hypothetical protein